MTSHGRPVASIALIATGERVAASARASLLRHLANCLVLVRRAGWSQAKAGAAILSWGDAFPLIESSNDVLLAAADLASAHQLGIWDAVILSAAADARCRMLLSEDLQEGFTWRGVTVTNPFSASMHPLLEAFLDTSGL